MQRTLIFIIGLFALTSIAFSVYLYTTRPKLAYVRSHELIEKYAGTVEARADFEKKKSAMVANVDSLKMLFDRSRIDYLNRANTMSAQQRSTREAELTQQQDQVYQYSTAIDEKIKEEDNTMMGAVLNQVNSFIEEYAEKNNIDFILGTTLSGSLLYGEQSMDITDDVLKELNTKYKGK